jgi:hypothetical protein
MLNEEMFDEIQEIVRKSIEELLTEKKLRDWIYSCAQAGEKLGSEVTYAESIISKIKKSGKDLEDDYTKKLKYYKEKRETINIEKRILNDLKNEIKMSILEEIGEKLCYEIKNYGSFDVVVSKKTIEGQV